MKQRVVTAIFFGIAMIGGIYFNRYTFFCLFAIIAAGCAWELTGLLIPADENQRRARQITACVMALIPPVVVGIYTINGGSCNLSTPEEIISGHIQNHIRAFATTMVFLPLVLFGAMLVELFSSGRSPFAYLGYYALSALYAGMPIAFLYSIATFDAFYQPNRVFGLLWLVWTNDSFAYFIGSKIGRRKLLERISPKKTWEGTVGGALLTLLMAWGISLFVHDFTPRQWLALGGVVAVFGTLGDLVESMLKRSVAVKDSGDLFPGHGGFLDRFDAFLFVLPFSWLVLMLLN